MAQGDLAVVERWLSGVNAAECTKVLALTSPEVEIVGPRGVGRGHELLAGWLARAGFTSAARRWFCSADGRVVVEQDATWTSPGGQPSRARVASAFVVREQRVSRFERFDSLSEALSATGLRDADEVLARSAPPG
jgi:hypothetical protein